MANYLQELVFKGVDDVSSTVGTITKSLGSLGTTSSKVDLQLAAVSRTGATLGRQLRTVGFAVAGAVTSLFWLSYRTSNAAEDLLNLSKKTGVSTDELQKLSYVSTQSGLDADSLAQGFKFLNRSISQAANMAGSQAGAAFAAMGVSLRDANGNIRSTQDVFYDLADAFAAAEDGPNKVNAAMNLLGRAGTQLIPVLDQGSAAIKKQGDNFSRYGNLIDKQGLKAISGFNNQVKTAGIAVSALGSVVAEALIPYLSPLVEEFSNWVASNKELIRTKVSDWIENVKTGITNILPKIEAFWKGATYLWDKIGGLEGVLKGFAAFIGAELIISLGSLVEAVGALGIALEATPIGWVVTGLALIGVAVYELNKAFPELMQTVAKTMDNIVGYVEDGARKILETLHLVKKEQGALAPNALQTTIDPVTGKATTAGIYVSKAVTPEAANAVQSANLTGTATNTHGPFEDLLQKLTAFQQGTAKPMQMNIKLDTQNEVSYVDIDSPLNTNVSLNSGPMVSY